MKRRSREELGRLWAHRLQVSESVFKRVQPDFDRFESALAGRFPVVMPMSPGDVNEKGLVTSWVNDQVELNMMLRVTNMVGAQFDDNPSFTFSRQPEEPEAACIASERAMEMLIDEGEAMTEGRVALRYMMTRGAWIMWPVVVRTGATPEEVLGSKTNPEDLVMAARTGQLKDIPAGTDFYATSVAARGVLEDPAQALGLMPDERARIAQLAETCEVEHQKWLSKAHRGPEAKITFVATPYGTWCQWDPTVTDVRRADWIARKLVLDRDEFLESDTFTDAAKAKVAAMPDDVSADPTASAADGARESTQALEEIGRIVVWEIWDRKHWSRHYWSPALGEETIGVDERYPYLDEEGKPLFRDFYPCVIRVPIKHNRDVPEQSSGVPFLAPGWPHQIELIQYSTALSRAAKRSGRVAIAGPNVDDSTISGYVKATDGAVIKMTPGYDHTKDGDPFKQIDQGVFPIEYIRARMQAMSDFANALGMSIAALTGEPIADTLGQEEIALKGSTLTQADLIRMLESGVAELATKAFILFRAYASDSEMASFLGVKALEPDEEGLTLVQRIRAMNIDGRKILCRFAASTRADDLASTKQSFDFFALSMGPLGRDSTGVPYFDPKTMLLRIAKKMDLQESLVEYEMTDQERIAAALMKMQASMMGQGGQTNAPGGGAQSGQGDPTGRKAGGERGPAAIPGAQSRGRAPQTGQQMTGAAMRPVTAV